MSDRQSQVSQAPAQAALDTPAREAAPSAVSNGERAAAAGLGSMPFPPTGSSVRVQGIDDYDPDVVADAVVAGTLASVGDPELAGGPEASAFRAAVANIVRDEARGRSGATKAALGDRLVSVSVRTEVRNLRVLERRLGPVTAGETRDRSGTGTGTVGAHAGGPAFGVEASYSQALTQGQGHQSTLGMDALQDVIRGDITTTWDIYHTYCPSAAPGAHPLGIILTSAVRAAMNPPVFDTGSIRTGYLTALRLVDE